MSEHIGKTIDGRYEVISLIGRGGMAEVYLATDERTGTDVALKMMTTDPESPDLASRFLRGARLSRRIRHPFVTSTFGLGQWGQPVRGHYVVLEYVDGLSLNALLDTGLDTGAVCTLMSQVLAALAHVHAHGVLHRDIKPDNIMVRRYVDGSLQTKLTDFGIAASMKQDVNVTNDREGVVVGTPAYMAPEQVHQRGVYAPALDLYAVGTTMYRMLSGTLPFKKKGMALLVARVTDKPAPFKARADVEVPEVIAAIVMKLLSPRPERRFPVAADVLRLLAPHCGPATMSEDVWQSLFDTPDRLPTINVKTPEPTVLDCLGDTVAFIRAAGAARAGIVPFWGREPFVRRFDDMVESAEHGDGQVAVLSGPTGIGKSSVMEHIALSLAEQGRFIVLRTAYHTHGGPTSGLRHAIDKHLGTVGRGIDTVREAALEFLRRYDDVDSKEADDLVAFLRPRTAIRDPEAVEALSFNFALVVRMLRRISQVKPVLLLLDSMEQSDIEAVSFVTHLLFEARIEPFPILCIGAFSDHLADKACIRMLHKNDRYLGESFHCFVVPPLPHEAMVDGLLAHNEMGTRTAESIAQRSQGNPLFAVHLARAGREALEDEDVTVHTLDERMDLPKQLAGVLALSLDECLAQTDDPDVMRDVCRCVAVLGEQVRVDLLMRYMAVLGIQVEIDLALDRLIDVGVLVEGPIEGHPRVALQPALLRDLLVQETGPRRRRTMQRHAAEVRMQWAAANLDQEAGAIADHFEAAGDTASAVTWWRRSIPYEALSGTPGKGVRAGLQVLRVVAPDSQDYADIAITTARLLLDMGELTDAAAVLTQVVAADDPDNALRAGDLLADVYENAGEGARWDSLIEAMGEREAEAGPTGLRALYCARSMWLNSRGHRDQGFAEAQRAAEAAEHGREAQRAAQRLVYTCLSRGDLVLGEEAARKALAHAGDQPELKARSLRALGIVLVWKQHGADAIACFEEVLKLARRHGLHARLPIGWHDLGEALRVSGQLAEARDAYRHALDTARQMQLSSSVELIQPKLIMCDLLEGNFEDAEDRVESFIPDALAAGLALAEPFGRMLLAWAHALAGDLEAASSAYDRVSDMRGMAIDPQFPLIMEQIGVAFSTPPDGATRPAYDKHAREALTLAAEFWLRYGQEERSTRCKAILAAL